MVNIAIRLSPAIDEWLASCASHGDSVNTLRNKQHTLDKLLNDSAVGNIMVRNVQHRHIDATFETMRRSGMRNSSINTHRSNLLTFFKWCQTRRYITSTMSPMEGTRTLKSVPRKRLFVPVGKFAHLSDCAEHPRDRAIISVGLYLFLRQSEVRTLTVGDVNLDAGCVDVLVHKTRQRDRMPISSELDAELRRWLTFYSDVAGGLDPSFALIPARGRPVMAGKPGSRGLMVRLDDGRALKPDVPLRQIERPVQLTLERAGFTIYDDEGKLNFEGMHTLRRSGARARFDALVANGHDGAIREVQAMLHHSSLQMTEHYLGLTLDVDRRDRNIRGKPMFPAVTDGNVVPLPQRRELNL